MSEEDAHRYAEGVRRGGTLVTARVPDTDSARFEPMLDQSSVDLGEGAQPGSNRAGRVSILPAPRLPRMTFGASVNCIA